MPPASRKTELTPDQLAIDILLSNRTQERKQQLLTGLANEVTAAVHLAYPCPECGSTRPKETNELPSTDYEYSVLCLDCGQSWSPNAE